MANASLLSTAQRDWVIRQSGFDPSQYQLDDDGVITPKQVSASPAVADDFPHPKLEAPKSSNDFGFGGTALKTAIHEAPSAVAGTGVAAYLTPAAQAIAQIPHPLAKLAYLIPPIAGAITAAGTHAGQVAIEKEVAPEYLKSLEETQQANPWGARLGSAGAMLAGGFNPNPMNVGRATLSAGKLLTKPIHGARLTLEEAQNLSNVGLGTAIGTGIQAGHNIVAGQPIETGLGEAALSGALFNSPNWIAKRMGIGHEFDSLHPVRSDITEGTPVVQTEIAPPQTLPIGGIDVAPPTLSPELILSQFPMFRREKAVKEFTPRMPVYTSDQELQLLNAQGQLPSRYEQPRRVYATVDTPNKSAAESALNMQQLWQEKSPVVERLKQTDFERALREKEAQDSAALLQAAQESQARLNEQRAAAAQAQHQANVAELQQLLSRGNVGRPEVRTEPLATTELGKSLYPDYTGVTEAENAVKLSPTELEAERIQSDIEKRNPKYSEEAPVGQRPLTPAEQRMKNEAEAAGIKLTPTEEWNAKMRNVAAFRGQQLVTDKPLVGPSGKPVAGVSFARTSPAEPALAATNPQKADVTTAPHEMSGHNFFADLATSKNKSDNQLHSDYLEFTANNPEFAAINEARVKSGREPWTPEEFIANEAGATYARDRLGLRNETEFRTWWNDIKSHFKTKWKSASGDDYARVLNYKFVNDAPFNPAKYSGVGAAGGAKMSEESTKSPARARYEELQNQIMERVMKGDTDSQEFQSLWKESEAIKNNHGGMPPKYSDEAPTSKVKNRVRLVRQFNDAVKEIKAGDQRPLGLRNVIAAEKSYKVGWSNGSQRWDVSTIGSYERTAVDRNINWNNPTELRAWRDKYKKLLDKPFASKGEEIRLDSNQILVGANSKQEAQLIANHLPEPPFAVNAAERNPLLDSSLDFETALERLMALEPNKIDTTQETSKFLDKLDQAKYSDEAPTFVTQTQKELERDKPFGLQLSRNGTVETAQLKAKIAQLPKAEQELLKMSGIDDQLRLPATNAKELSDWIKSNGPKVEVHSYGMEGKVSEARREYDRMTHEWLDTLSSEQRQQVLMLRGSTPQESLKWLVQNGWKPADATKASKWQELRNKAENEPRDTSPRATTAYDTVSAFLAKASEKVKRAYAGLANVFRANPRSLAIPLENTYLGKSPEQYVIQQPNGKYMVNPNPHAGPMDSIHPGKLYNTREEAIAAAQQLHEHLQILDKLEEHGIMPKWTKSTREALLSGSELPTNVQRVDVVIPSSQWTKDALLHDLPQDADKTLLWIPDNLHENLPNTLGWAMIQYKTGPKGEKIAVIVEAQSRWGQKMRELRKELNETPTSESNSRALQQSRLGQDHPLLSDYNRLILKSAIDQARKEGATHIVVSDAETAMMSEGHDLQTAKAVKYITVLEAVELVGKQIPDFGQPNSRDFLLAKRNFMESEFGKDYRDGKFATVSGTLVRYDKPEVNQYEATKNFAKQVQQLKPGQYAIIKQEPGMRLNYDNALPKIAEELTGMKGEKVSLGEHKNAYEQAPSGVNAVARQERNPVTGEWENVPLDKKTPRSNLIFRNPDGTPKTDVSGMMFPLGRAAERRATGEPYSIAGAKYSEEAPIADTTTEVKPRSPLTHYMSGEVQKVAKQSKPVADAMTKFYERNRAHRGKLETGFLADVFRINPFDYFSKEGLLNWVKMDTPENRRVVQYLDAVSDGEPEPFKLNDTEQQIADAVRASLKRSLAMREARKGAENVKGLAHFNEGNPNYFPHTMSREAAKTLAETPTGDKATQYYKDFIAYQKSNGGMTQQEAENAWSTLRGAFSKESHNLAQRFGPIDKSAGIGLPKSMREQNLIDRMSRFNRRYSRRLAYYDAFETKPDVMEALFNKKNGIETNENVKNVLEDIYGVREHNETRRQAIAGVIRAGMMGTLAGAKDFTTNFTLSLQHMDFDQVLPAAASAFDHAKENYRRAQETGVVRYNIAGLEQGEGGLDSIINGLHRTRDILNAAQGRQLLENGARTIAFGQGRFLAGEALHALANKKLTTQKRKFLDDFVPNWENYKTAKAPDEVINEAAAKFVESVQGGYDYRGLPSVAMRGSLAPYLSLARWNIEKFNNFMTHVVEPARGGNYKPLLMSTIGMIIGGAAIETIVEEAQNKKSKAPTMKEIEEAKSEEQLKLAGYKAAYYASMSGYLGVVGDLIKSAYDMKYKNRVNTFGNPLLEGGALMLENIDNLTEAMSKDDLPEVTKVIGQLLEDFSQTYRVANAQLNPDKIAQNERSDKFRDLKLFNMAQGYDIPDVSDTRPNPFIDTTSREFKQTTDLPKARELSRELIAKAKEKSGGDMEKFRNELDKLKRNSYQTMPSPERLPKKFRSYYEWLVKTQGQEKADEIKRDYLLHSRVNEAKNEMIP